MSADLRAADLEVDLEVLDFGRASKAIDSPERRLEAWSTVNTTGGSNMLRIDGVLYSWDTKPRLQKNGAAIGRVYAQARGQLTRDIGAYKIDKGGRVEWLPAPLRAVLPGGVDAGAGDEESKPQQENV